MKLDTWLQILDRLAVWLAKLLPVVAAYFAVKEHEERKHADERSATSKREAQKWADAGTVDTATRLRDLAKRKRDDT